MGFFDKIFGKKKEDNGKKIYDIVCTNCFKKFHPDEVLFRATHSTDADEEYMLQEDEVLDEFLKKFGLEGKGLMECVIDPNDIPEENQTRIDGGVLIEIIDKYGHSTNKRLCPACHNDLPATAGRVPSNIISFVGASQVGKTVYMTSLIHTLQNTTAPCFDAACYPNDIESKRRFQEFEDALFVNGVLPSATQKERKMDSFTFEFKFYDPSKPPLTLSFFDVAGEAVTDPEYLKIRAQHIRNSSALIFLVDPIQIRTIRNRLSIKMGENQGEFASQYDESRDVVIALRQDFISYLENGRTDIPTAVVLTKSDMLKLLVDDNYVSANSNIFMDIRHEKYLNLTEFTNIDGEVRRFIEKVDRPFKGMFDVNFTDSAYFAISALGRNPVNQRVEGLVEPVRVDEPLLWLLYKLKFIEGRMN